MNRIVTIFGKRGSGKSTLSKEYMVRLGGKVIFLSPVENLTLHHTEVWSTEELLSGLETLNPGQVLLVRLADNETMDLIACHCIFDGSGYTVVIDEIEKYRYSHDLLDMIHYSRHFEINIITNTRRYADVPRLLTSQSDEILIAQTHEPRDISYLREFIDKESVETIQTLPQYHFLNYPSKLTVQTKNLHF